MNPVLVTETFGEHLGRGTWDKMGKPISRISINPSNFESPSLPSSFVVFRLTSNVWLISSHRAPHQSWLLVGRTPGGAEATSASVRRNPCYWHMDGPSAMTPLLPHDAAWSPHTDKQREVALEVGPSPSAVAEGDSGAGQGDTTSAFRSTVYPCSLGCMAKGCPFQNFQNHSSGQDSLFFFVLFLFMESQCTLKF